MNAIEQRYLETGHLIQLDPRIGLRQRVAGRRLELAPVEGELRAIALERLAQMHGKRKSRRS